MKLLKPAGILLLVFALGAGAGALITRSVVRERLHRGGISSLEDAVMLAHHSGQRELVDWGGLKTYAKDDRSVAPGKVIFFGDSITASWNLPHGWINRGISGQTTEQMLVRYRQDVLDLRPSTVVVLAGVNDARDGDVSTLATQNNIETMVELAQLHGIKPILCSLLPTGHHPLETPVGDPVAQVQNLNSWLASYAQNQGISFVNYYDSMLGESDAIKPELTDDGLHPNEAGYSVMDRIIEKSITQTSETPKK